MPGTTVLMRGVTVPDLPIHDGAPLGEPRKPCPACGGRAHRHDSRLLADFDCYWRQFSATKLPAPRTLPLTPTQLEQFAAWLNAANARPRPGRNKEDEFDPEARVYF